MTNTKPISAPSWRKENGVIYLSVTSDGTTGPEWIDRLESKQFRLGDCLREALLSDEYRPTVGVTSEIGIIRSLDKSHWTSKEVCAEAERRGLQELNMEIEILCLMRDLFSDKEIKLMNLWRINMLCRTPDGFGNNPKLLMSNEVGGGRWIVANSAAASAQWDRESGFAYIVPQG